MKKNIFLKICILAAMVLFFNCPVTKEDVSGWKVSEDIETSTTISLANPITMNKATGTNTGVTLQGRTVYLSNFWIGQTEVAYAQWLEVYTWATAHGYTIANSGINSSTYPVSTINWRDTIVWCNALSEKEGLIPCYTYGGSVINDSSNATACDNAAYLLTVSGYRLPTEAEWEYAARGGQFGIRNETWNCIYSGSNTLSEVAVHGGPSIEKVGTKKANALGLYDMSGNVWEWCYDWSGTIGTTAETNPIGVSSGTNRVVRGGSYNTDASYSQVFCISYTVPITANFSLGFRVAKKI